MFDSESAVARSVLQPLYALESRLDKALYRGHGYKIVVRSLDELEQYTLLHSNNPLYQPDAEPYAASRPLTSLYQQLADQVSEWLREYWDGANVLAGEILHYLRSWLSNHSHLSTLESTAL